MAGAFTDKEIADELRRRREAEMQRDEERSAAQRRHLMETADAVCLHCGLPFHRHTSAAGEFSICDGCLGD